MGKRTFEYDPCPTNSGDYWFKCEECSVWYPEAVHPSRQVKALCRKCMTGSGPSNRRELSMADIYDPKENEI